MKTDLLRRLPSIDELLNTDKLRLMADKYCRNFVADIARKTVTELREKILSAEDLPVGSINIENTADLTVKKIEKIFTPSMRNAINAAGIILHTGLGRAMLSMDAANAIKNVTHGFCTLAADRDTGNRMSRDIHINDLLCMLTGADASTIANNNAAATMLILNTIARGKEVIISRGQLVEIGGSFRMPDVMESSGAIMREVGTTNKTHLKDYVSAINENTGAIMRVHHSNYRIIGFHDEPSISELCELGRIHNIPVIDDLGSGALIDLSRYGLEPEPMITDSVKSGADVICFSGDKLIGGPQCGIIIGKTEMIKQIKKNPLSRALRVGKMTVAGLEATLKLFLTPNNLEENHPVYKMMSAKIEELDKRAVRIASRLIDSVGGLAEISVIDGGTQIGSGSVPGEKLPSKLLNVKPLRISAGALAKRLRYADPPIYVRIQHESLLFDMRTIQSDEDNILTDALSEILLEIV